MGQAERQAAADLRAKKAIGHIARAREELDQARRELAALRGEGAATVYVQASRLVDQVWAFGCALDEGRIRSRWELDHEPEEP